MRSEFPNKYAFHNEKDWYSVHQVLKQEKNH
jgi:hypothetical protein